MAVRSQTLPSSLITFADKNHALLRLERNIYLSPEGDGICLPKLHHLTYKSSVKTTKEPRFSNQCHDLD